MSLSEEEMASTIMFAHKLVPQTLALTSLCLLGKTPISPYIDELVLCINLGPALSKLFHWFYVRGALKTKDQLTKYSSLTK